MWVYELEINNSNQLLRHQSNNLVGLAASVTCVAVAFQGTSGLQE